MQVTTGTDAATNRDKYANKINIQYPDTSDREYLENISHMN